MLRRCDVSPLLLSRRGGGALSYGAAVIRSERVRVTVIRVLLSIVQKYRYVSSSTSTSIVECSSSEKQIFYVTTKARDGFWNSAHEFFANGGSLAEAKQIRPNRFLADIWK